MIKTQSNKKFCPQLGFKLSPSAFFNLKDYYHKELFDGCKYVWEALSNIMPYIKRQKNLEILSLIPNGAHVINKETVAIGEGTVVEQGAYIKGPCIIGENCTIRHGAYIRGNVVAGNNCVIGHDTEIKNSILLNNSKAAHFAYIGDSILGNDVNLGAGTKCANLKLDNKNVYIYLDGKKIDTGRRKLGVILGDLSQTGCNCTTNPGTLIGPNTICYPNINMSGVIPEKKIVKNMQKTKILTRRL